MESGAGLPADGETLEVVKEREDLLDDVAEFVALVAEQGVRPAAGVTSS
ncbi:hypothetical protein ACFWJY_09115 [Streptomyces anulatus]